jgi:hypothetical protein
MSMNRNTKFHSYHKAILWERLVPVSTSTSTVDGTSIPAVNELPVQTFMDEPCLGPQVDPQITPITQSMLATSCFKTNVPDLWTKSELRLWLTVTMYLNGYSHRAKAYVLQLHISYNVITRQNTICMWSAQNKVHFSCYNNLKNCIRPINQHSTSKFCPFVSFSKVYTNS